MSTGDHDDIRALLDKWAEALRKKDAATIIACQSQSIRYFSLAPPLEVNASSKAELQEWLDTWDGDLIYEIRNMDLRVGADTGWCSALARLGGRKIGQSEQAFWMRLTVAFARENGRWLIVHIHESVPFAMDGQPLAIFDLKP